MKIEVLESNKENVLLLNLKNADVKFANLLRRTIVSKIPTYAINQVTFYENSSTLFDEYISHRMGLVPLSFPSKIKKDQELIFVVDEKGPKKVYSGDLKPADHAVKPAVEKIPLITLTEGQSLRAEAKAVLGEGTTHAKFQSGTSSYDQNDKTGDIKFKVESFYQMAPKELVSKALSIIDQDFLTLEKAVQKMK